MDFKQAVATNEAISKATYKVQKAAPTIAFIAGAVGSVAGLYLMWRAARKHDETVFEVVNLIEEAHGLKEPDEDGVRIDSAGYRKALIKAYIQAGFKLGKLYAPVAATELASLGLMSLGYGKLNSRYINTLAAATLLEREYARYRNKIIDIYGEDADKEARLGLKKQQIEIPDLDENGNPKLTKNGNVKTKKVTEYVLDDPDLEGYSPYARIFDKKHSKRFDGDEETGMATSWFNREYLIKTQGYFNMLLKYRPSHTVFWNEVLVELGYEPTQEGQIIGWHYDPANQTGDNIIIFVPDELYDESYRAKSIVLDFNLDGSVWKHLPVALKKRVEEVDA